MFVFQKNVGEQRKLALADLSSKRKAYLSAGLVSVLLFITLLYLGPGANLGLLGRRKDSQNTLAAGSAASEVESWVLGENVKVGSDSSASGGKYLEFTGAAGSTPATFQPGAPYYATFYYQWYKSSKVDSSWSYWTDHGNNPPSTWFSHYLPDSNTGSFDPANELYSSNDYTNFKWQVAKMAEAKQEVAIASWFGPGTKEDVTFDNIINSFMARTDNPYPNLRWSMYYEDEGFGDPSVATIVSDLNHIKTKYANSPYFLKINNKPVIFVYSSNADEPGTMPQRWKEANSQVGNSFYVVLKVFSGFATNPDQPDSWHQYAPAVRSGAHAPYSYFVSPGFWLDDGSAERLPRDPASFESAVKTMVGANAMWKLTQTWNEWGEGTSIEPGEQVKTINGRDEPDLSGYQFKNLYIDILNRNLPALEQGTGR